MNSVRVSKYVSRVVAVVFCILAGGLLAGNIASAEGGTRSFSPGPTDLALEKRIGAGYGCAVRISDSVIEVRVAGRSAAKAARRMVTRRSRVEGQRVARVRVVAWSQTLRHVEAVWTEAESRNPLQGSQTEGLTSLFSPSDPTSKAKCRSVVAQVFSWPGHSATSAQREWAERLEQDFPAVARADIQELTGPPIATARR